MLAVPNSSHAQKQLAKSLKILSAKTVYFDNQTGVEAVGTAAVAQLRKWGRFQIVHDKKTADLILLLSADPYNGGYIIFASGQTGTMDADGHIEQDRVPNYNRQAPVRDAYLTVIEPRSGQNLWSESHVWGGFANGGRQCRCTPSSKTAKANREIIAAKSVSRVTGHWHHQP
jgi:hypothetical protein